MPDVEDEPGDVGTVQGCVLHRILEPGRLQFRIERSAVSHNNDYHGRCKMPEPRITPHNKQVGHCQLKRSVRKGWRLPWGVQRIQLASNRVRIVAVPVEIEGNLGRVAKRNGCNPDFVRGDNLGHFLNNSRGKPLHQPRHLARSSSRCRARPVCRCTPTSSIISSSVSAAAVVCQHGRRGINHEKQVSTLLLARGGSGRCGLGCRRRLSGRRRNRRRVGRHRRRGGCCRCLRRGRRAGSCCSWRCCFAQLGVGRNAACKVRLQPDIFHAGHGQRLGRNRLKHGSVHSLPNPVRPHRHRRDPVHRVSKLFPQQCRSAGRHAGIVLVLAGGGTTGRVSSSRHAGKAVGQRNQVQRIFMLAESKVCSQEPLPDVLKRAVDARLCEAVAARVSDRLQRSCNRVCGFGPPPRL